MDFPKDFKKCPHCGSEELVTHEAIKTVALQMKAMPKPMPYMERIELPLVQQGNLNDSAKRIPVMSLYHDICAGCGVRRLVRAEIVYAPKPIEPTKLVVPAKLPPNMKAN